MHQTRVFIAAMPPLLAMLVREALAGRPDVRILPDDAAGLAEGVDLVVVSSDDGHDEEGWGRSLQARADASTSILSVERRGTRASLYELRPHREDLGELTRESLIAAVQKSSARRSSPTNGNRPAGIDREGAEQ